MTYTLSHCDFLAILPRSEADATNVRALALELGTSGREVRQLMRDIVAERDPDRVVISLPQTHGVWLGDLQDLMRVRRQLVGRLVSLRHRIDDVEHLARRLGWEPSLLDFMEEGT
jgi:hypothetical protein